MFGQTVKLVDFGLATTDPISSDFGCGSTFYLSPGKVIHIHSIVAIVKDIHFASYRGHWLLGGKIEKCTDERETARIGSLVLTLVIRLCFLTL